MFNFVEEIYALSAPEFLRKPPPTFFKVHSLHRLYGVDAPAFVDLSAWQA